ncbi:hypothetical protein [Tenacibaculum geojense]|uniref:Uncharacterized protein n=1 Tax=Tenacibaculum geojense TaxID=915352 RepID=A0ABW3JS03_9FLAO
MKKITLLLILSLTSITSIFSQDRDGTIFYSYVERTEESYNVQVDIYEMHGTEYIEVELFNEDEVKLASNLVTLRFKNNKYYLIKNEEETEVNTQDINLSVENPDNSIKYPMIKVKLLDKNYQVVDFSQKVFY